MTSAQDPLSVAARQRILSAWSGAIGVAPVRLRENEWVYVERDDLDAVVVVRVGGYGLVVAPTTALDVVRRAPQDVLLDATALAKLLPVGANPIGTADPFFVERAPEPRGQETRATVTADVTAMRGEVSASEWDESGLADAERKWTTLSPTGGPAAIAGFAAWRSELAQMAAVADPQHRGGGFAYEAAAVATREALSAGLIVQWRSRQGNVASRSLAQRLGFVQFGVQSTVALDD